ncbi:MAG TPA: PAS domain-containing protein [Desulfobacteraceae bacterium]|nr:PAS domain-containing protein [Desulfobacteraceae bacterium]
MNKLGLERLLADKKNLEHILDSLPDGIIAHDPWRRIVYFNRAAQEITGFSSRDVVGKDCHEAFGSPFCGERCAFKEGPPEHWQDRFYPLNIVTGDGVSRRLELTVTGMYNDKGEFAGVIAVFKDVTDITGLRMQLGQLRSFSGIVGQSPEMIHVFEQVQALATNDYSVHITGETGTGKEMVAAALHNESRRGGGPFVTVNCAALPEGVLESELFGHVKGAFTGALRDKKGRFELAHGGTLFLDEIADLPKAMQAKLLRVLQEGAFERVGGEKTVSVDVRILSATNRDLKQEVDAGRFRDDLYYRLNVVPIRLPSLRERKTDIPLLVDHFLHQAEVEGQIAGAFSDEALARMLEYNWPGNVRELQSAVRYAVVRSRGRTIRPEHLPLELRDGRLPAVSAGPSRKLNAEMVRAALEKTGGNKARAARLMGVGRATLYRFLKDTSVS